MPNGLSGLWPFVRGCLICLPSSLPTSSYAATWKCTPETTTFPDGSQMKLRNSGLVEDAFTYDTTTGIQRYRVRPIPSRGIPATTIEEKFTLLSNSQFFINSAGRACSEKGDLCVGRFFSLSLPGTITLDGKQLPKPVPDGRFLLVEGNALSVTVGQCEILP